MNSVSEGWDFRGILLSSFSIALCIVWLKTIGLDYAGTQRKVIRQWRQLPYPRLERVLAPFECGDQEVRACGSLWRSLCVEHKGLVLDCGLWSFKPWRPLWVAYSLLWMHFRLSSVSLLENGGNKGLAPLRVEVTVQWREAGAHTGPGTLSMLVEYYLDLLLLFIVSTPFLSCNSHTIPSTHLKGKS